MPLTLMCTVCNEPINITDEMLEEAKELGIPFAPVHDYHTNDGTPEPEREFKIVVTVFEVFPAEGDEDDDVDGKTVEEKIAQFGGEVKAVSFSLGLPLLLKELNHGWEQVQKMASVIDGEAPTSTPVTVVPKTTESGLILPG